MTLRDGVESGLGIKKKKNSWSQTWSLRAASVRVWIPRWMELFSALSLPAEREAHKNREPIEVEKNNPTALEQRRSCGSWGN